MPLFIKTCHTFLLKADILFYIIFSKRFAHLTISSKKNLKKYLHDTNAKYILKIYGINSLIYKLSIFWIYSSYVLHKKLNKILQEPDWPFVSFWNLKSPYFICFHSFSFVVPLPLIRCHSLLFVIICYLSLSFIVILCHLIYYSLSLVGLRCRSFYHSLSFVVTWCTTRLSFYKRSFATVPHFSLKMILKNNQISMILLRSSHQRCYYLIRNANKQETQKDEKLVFQKNI